MAVVRKPFFKPYRILLYFALVSSSLIMLFPLYWVVVTSFKLEEFVFASPPQWFPDPYTLQNYIAVIVKHSFGKYMFNSLLVATSVTFAHVCFDTMAGYAFAKLHFWGRNTIFFILLITLMVPFQVNLIPIYRMMSSAHLLNTYWALILPNMTSVFGIFLVRQYMLSLPNELIESARIDGCSEFGIFWKIIFPQCTPIIATLVIFTFMGAWNDFIWARIAISNESLFTLPLGLANLQAKNTSMWGQNMAGTVFAALPLICVFLIFQKRFYRRNDSGCG